MPEYGRRFLSRRLHRLRRNCRAQYVVQPVLSADFFHCRGVRHENRVILVLARNGQPFGKKRANNLARHILDPHDFSDGVLYAEELIPHGPSDHAYVSRSLNVILSKRRALIHVPALNVEIFGRDSAVSGVPVLVSVDDLDRTINIWRDALNQRHLILNGHSIAHHQRFRAVCSGAPAIDGASPRFNPYKIVAKAVELLLDARLARFSNRHHANHRRDPDGDAQDRKNTPQFVSQQRDERRAQQARVIHFPSRPLQLFSVSQDKWEINHRLRKCTFNNHFSTNVSALPAFEAVGRESFLVGADSRTDLLASVWYHLVWELCGQNAFRSFR